MPGFGNDIRFAFRRLSKSPGFTLAAILTIALGVSLNAGAFSIVNGILFSTLPVPAADELVDISEYTDAVESRGKPRAVDGWVTTSSYTTYRDNTQSLSGLMGYSQAFPVTLVDEDSSTFDMRYVTCNYFDVLRQPPALGRPLTQADCVPGGALVAVLSHDFWASRFGSNPDVVGRTIQLNLQQVTVVGIAAEDAYLPELIEIGLYAPISAQPVLRPDRDWYDREDGGWLTLIGRRFSDVTIDAVRAEFDLIAQGIDEQRPGRASRVTIEPASIARAQPEDSVILLGFGILVMAPFVLILVIACTNIANLVQARGMARSSEIALRLSLGASRGRIVQQLLAETLVLSIAGTTIGALLGSRSFTLLADSLLSAASLPVALPDPQLDYRVLLFTLVLTVCVFVLAGLAPALQTSNANLHTTARQASAVSGQSARSRLQGTLIAIQVTICTALIVVTGIVLRFYIEVNTVDPGFPAEDITIVETDVRGLGYPNAELLASFQNRLEQRIRELPVVEAASLANNVPWERPGVATRINVSLESEREIRPMRAYFVEPDYLATIGVPVVRGRQFTPDERWQESKVAIVSESQARTLWPDEDPIGQTVNMRSWDIRSEESWQAWQIVGIAADAQTILGETDPKLFYIPNVVRPANVSGLSLMVRNRGGYTVIAPLIRDAIISLDPQVRLTVRPLESFLSPFRYVTAMISGTVVFLGLVAVTLAAIGIYGVVSFVVNARTQEIGVRLALGARSNNVLFAILRRTFRPVLFGAVTGLLVAFALTKTFTVTSFLPLTVDSGPDPVSMFSSAVFVLAVGLLASTFPVVRGLRADPMATLRSE